MAEGDSLRDRPKGLVVLLLGGLLLVAVLAADWLSTKPRTTIIARMGEQVWQDATSTPSDSASSAAGTRSGRNPISASGRGGGSGIPARVLVEDSEWAHKAEAALREWRATLFGRMATQYRELERERSGQGARTIGRVEPHQLTRYDLFNPFVECPSGTKARLGADGDGGKWLCPEPYLQRPGCIIYSLGSAGNFEFEEAMLQATACEVHTFDCTYDGQDLPNSNGRHKYHKTCVGQAKGGSSIADTSMFMTYDAILAKLQHTRVDLLKIDIEGYEFDVFAGFKPTCELPMQIAMEVHYSLLYASDKNAQNFNNLFWPLHELSLGELATFFGHFADMGYGIISREDNLPYGIVCCAEFSFVKIEQPAGCPSS